MVLAVTVFLVLFYEADLSTIRNSSMDDLNRYHQYAAFCVTGHINIDENVQND